MLLPPIHKKQDAVNPWTLAFYVRKSEHIHNATLFQHPVFVLSVCILGESMEARTRMQLEHIVTDQIQIQ
jgi:hypothetical protein